MSSMDSKQKYKLRKFVEELEKHRGRHTELVSVYIPEGYDMNKIINHLAQEQGTATNIKSSSTKKNVIGALERMIQHLRLFKQTPPHGLAAFSGNVAEREGQSDLQVWSLEPPVPLNIRIYRCDKEFVLEPLREMMEVKEVYGLVVMDRREASIAYLKGKAIIPLVKSHSMVPGKFKAGGQCLVNDSLVQLSDGSISEIKDLLQGKKVKSILLNAKFAMTDSMIKDKWKIEKSKIYKIITKNPRLEIQASKDHIFFVSSPSGIVEVSAEHLKQDYFLLMPEKISIKGSHQKINSKKYYNSFIIDKKGQELLKNKRFKKHLFQKELAKKINLTQTTISSYEIGKCNADRESLKVLCGELGINFESFLKKHTKQYLYKNIKLPSLLDEEFSQFLGYLIGDGCIETDRVTFFEQNKGIALTYQRKFNRLFSTKASCKFRESKNYYQIRFTSRPLVRLIQSEFPEIKKALDSEVPDKICKSDDKVVAAFLRGIFDAEGFVQIKRGVSLGMNNKKLVQQIQFLLLRFGIIGSLQEYDNRANRYSNHPRFTIDVYDKKSLELFMKKIGFTSKEKYAKLISAVKARSSKTQVRQILVSGRKIRQIIESKGYNLQLFPRVNNFFRNERMMGKETFQKSILANIHDKELCAELNEILKYPVLPVKIKKIVKYDKTVEMVDISVANQNFIANGLIVHNSAKRFAENRELAAKDFYHKIADHMKDQFFMNTELKGIIVGGPGPTKYEFVEGNFITNDLKKKIIAIKDITYTDEFGLNELLEKSADVLAAEEVTKEKELMNKFFEKLAKEPGKVTYGEHQVMEALKIGAVDIVLISETIPDEKIQEFEKEAEPLNTKVEIISTETREGVQLRDIGGFAAMLRYSSSY